MTGLKSTTHNARDTRRAFLANALRGSAAFCCLGMAGQARAQGLPSDELQRSVWDTTYDALGGDRIQAMVVFDGPRGYYEIPGARGELWAVRYESSTNVPGNATITGRWSLGGVEGTFRFFVSGGAFSGSWQSSGRSGVWNGRFESVLQSGGGTSPASTIRVNFTNGTDLPVRFFLNGGTGLETFLQPSQGSGYAMVVDPGIQPIVRIYQPTGRTRDFTVADGERYVFRVQNGEIINFYE